MSANWVLLFACLCTQAFHIYFVFLHQESRLQFFPVDTLWTISLAMSESDPSRLPLASTSSICFLAPVLLFIAGSSEKYEERNRSSTCVLFCFCTCILAVYSYQFWSYSENPYREIDYNHSRLLLYVTNDTTFMLWSSLCVLQLLIEKFINVFKKVFEMSSCRAIGETVRRLGNVACIFITFLMPHALQMEAFYYVILACLIIFSLGIFTPGMDTVVNKLLYLFCFSLATVVTILYIPKIKDPVPSCNKTSLASLFHVCVSVLFTIVYYSSSCTFDHRRRSVAYQSSFFLLSLIVPVLSLLPLFVKESTRLSSAISGAPWLMRDFVELGLPLNSTVEECRNEWNKAGSLKQLTLLYRTHLHPSLPGSCVAIEFGPTNDFSSPEWQLHHTTHCFSPLSSPLNGCVHEACLGRVRTASLLSILILFFFRLYRVRKVQKEAFDVVSRSTQEV